MHTVTEHVSLSPQERQRAHELDVYGKRDLCLASGSGAHLSDEAGNTYIDCVGGHGAANIGHAHPTLAAAIAAQASTLISCPGAYYNDVRAQYLSRLTAAAPEGLNRAFLCNSGTEAVEAALKFSRLTTGRPRFVAARRGFHGRTFGAMSATFNPNYSRGCEPLLGGFSHIPFNDIHALEEALADDVAGLILEVIQGEGGVRPADTAFLQAARELCDRTGTLLIIDEVQTGFGRTGRLFACEHHDLQPDILCLAKAIAGGMPMGAVVVSDKVKAPIGKHGSTFGGNPLAAAAALATLQIIEEERLCEAAQEKGEYLFELLNNLQHPIIRQIRGQGLMVGIELATRVKPILPALAKKGVLALPAGPSVLRLLPPLVISKEDIATVVAAIDSVLAEI